MEEDISWMSKDALCWVDFTEQEEATFKQGLIKEF